METYEGVKFKHRRLTTEFAYDDRLSYLNHSAYIFSQLGLTPVHPEGAYGNQSYRTSDNSFIITKSGMVPGKDMDPSNYCEIVGFDKGSNTFSSHGRSIPSSESFLHNEIYSALPSVHAILHGHSTLLNAHSTVLNIPTTSQFFDYGTIDLARSALELAKNNSFFILKDHGFVALGTSIKTAEKMVLDYYQQLINLLKNEDEE